MIFTPTTFRKENISSLTKNLKIDWSKQFDNVRFFRVELSVFLLVIIVLPCEANQIVSEDWRDVLVLLRLLVHVHVILQISLLAESSLTDLTLEWPGPAKRRLMKEARNCLLCTTHPVWTYM